MRKTGLTAIVVLCCAFISFAQQTATSSVPELNSIEKAFEKFRADAELKNASITFQVKSLSDNKSLAEFNPAMSIVPASIMKVITTATALELLGGGYSFKTHLQYSGYIDENCVLHGNIYIQGGGDPTLGSKYFTDGDPSLFMDDWALLIRNAGIDSVTGAVIGDAEIYSWENVPSTWVWGDIGNGYGTAPSGLSIYDNICVLRFNTGSDAGDSAVIECMQPYIPDLEFENDVKADNVNNDNSYIYGAPYSYSRQIRGSLPKGKEGYEVKGSIPDPSYLAAFELEYALNRRGVGIGNRATTVRMQKINGSNSDEERKTIYTNYSPSLISIINITNLYSVNLFAEHLVNQIGVVKYGHGHVGSGTAAVLDFWSRKGIDTEGLYLSDGSGLSRFDAVSASHMVAILTAMYNGKNSATFLKTLPVAGKSGTLSYIGKGTSAQGRVFAKSGTMTRVKSYAGYVKTVGGKMLVFTIIVNNFNCTTRQMEKKLEKLFVAMANFS